MAQVKKLSVATVYGAIDLKKIVNSDKPVKVMTAYGMAVGTKSGSSTYGEWTALVGQFKAVHPETGEVSEASQLFLPDVALIPIQVALAANNSQAVSFAINVFAQRSKNNKPGGSPYEYTFEPLLPPAEDDPVKRLEERMREAGVPLLGNSASGSDDAAKPAAKGRGK